MAETLEMVKQAVKKEFNQRKKVEEGLKLSHVYNDFSRRAGYRNWNTYCAILKRRENSGNGGMGALYGQPGAGKTSAVQAK